MRRVPPSSVLLLGFAVISVLSGPSRAEAIGLLVPTRADVEPLMIRYHRVRVTVRERAAETRVEQTFRNHTDQVLEGTYVFPVPDGATVSGFAMWVDGRRQEGELLDAGQARRVYEEIVARMRDPGLVEHIGGNLFRARVFPIQPRSEQRIEIRFSQTLDYQDGVVHYRYPLRTAGRAARTLEDLTITTEVVSRTPIRAVYSPTHRVSVHRPDEHHATVGFEQGQVTLDRDYDLFYAVQDGDVGLSLLTHRAPGEDGYFLAMIAPRTELTERQIAAKEVIFVLDTSGSMVGDKMERARAALDHMLLRLNGDDTFQVVRFSTDVERLFDAPVTATRDHVERARRQVRQFVAAGGTAIDEALQAGLGAPRRARHPRMVVFLTDGMPTIGETDPRRIVERTAEVAGDARLFVFGVGDDVNTTFLDTLAQNHGGVGDYFRDGAEMERRLSAFYDRIAYPVLTDLRLEVPGAVRVTDVYPRDLGHLYKGGQLLVVGRYRGQGPARVELSGLVSGRPARQSFGFDVRFAGAEPDNDFLPRLWSIRKVGFLLDQIRLQGEQPELREEVVRLARLHGIVTPYTSYLVVEDQAEPAPERATAPPPRPAANGPRPQTTTSESTTVYDFEDSLVDGDLVRPDGEMLHVRRRGRGQSLVRPRRSFEPAAPASRRPPAAAAPRPNADAPPRDLPVEAAPMPAPGSGLAPQGGFGAHGRDLSRRLRQMREAEQATAAGNVRHVGGATLVRRDGRWVDSRYRAGLRELRVRYASPAYFTLLRGLPARARAAFAVGDRVVVVLPGGRAVIVSPDAPPGVSDDAVRRFLSDGE